jgi:hypothetical protein
MKTLILCLGFYGLGIFNCAVFAAVYMLHRPRYTAPTLRNRNAGGLTCATLPK